MNQSFFTMGGGEGSTWFLGGIKGGRGGKNQFLPTDKCND